MIVTLAAIGRLKASDPEQGLARDWIDRAAATGRGLGFRGVRLVELDPRTPAPDPERESAAFLASIDPAAQLWLLDEGGDQPGSAGFARLLAQARDQGTGEVVLAIGGADGHGSGVRARARRSLAFGTWTWPHRLVRAMAAEQIYRGLTILAGTPYHRA